MLQLYHHCLFGTRFDFLCANYTAFDQKTFICHFVSQVDCPNSAKYFNRWVPDGLLHSVSWSRTVHARYYHVVWKTIHFTDSNFYSVTARTFGLDLFGHGNCAPATCHNVKHWKPLLRRACVTCHIFEVRPRSLISCLIALYTLYTRSFRPLLTLIAKRFFFFFCVRNLIVSGNVQFCFVVQVVGNLAYSTAVNMEIVFFLRSSMTYIVNVTQKKNQYH